MDADELFQKHTVEEVEHKLKQIRNNAEKKKEDLRQMVGQRYRDLIDAADTIVNMCTHANHAATGVEQMRHSCTTIQNSSSRLMGDIRSTPLGQTHSQVATIAVQLKLLIGTPEQVWAALEDDDYCTAALFYLLARTTYSHLKVDTQLTATNVLKKFPIVTTQWHAIAHFRERIIEASEACLSKSDLISSTACQAMAALFFLEDLDVQQAFGRLLAARQRAVKQLLSNANVVETAQQKTMACMSIVFDTLLLLDQLAIPRQQTNVDRYETAASSSPDTDDESTQHQQQQPKPTTFAKFVADLVSPQGSGSAVATGQTQQGSDRQDIEAATWLRQKFLSQSLLCSTSAPDYLVSFSPSTQKSTASPSASWIKAATEQWLADVKAIVADCLSTALEDVQEAAAIVDIRDAAYKWLKETMSKVDVETVLQRVVGGPFNVWNELFQPLVVDRVQDILVHRVTAGMNDAFEHLKSAIESQLSHLSEGAEVASPPKDRFLNPWNVGGSSWYPGLMDKLDFFDTDNADFVSLTNSRGKMPAQATLAALVLGCDDVSRRTIAVFDAALTAAAAEAQCLMVHPDDRVEGNCQPSRSDGSSHEPFDPCQQSTAISSFLRDQCKRGVQQFVLLVSELRSRLVNDLNDVNADGSNRHRTFESGQELSISSSLCLLARTCRAVARLSAALPAVVVQQSSRHTGKPGQFRRPLRSRLRQSDEETVLDDLIKSLIVESSNCFNPWAKRTAERFGLRFAMWLKRRGEKDTAVSASAWQTHTIKEESESGVELSSTVSTPSQVDPELLALLCSLNAYISSVGGHAVPLSAIRHLLRGLGKTVASSIEAFLEDTSEQSFGEETWVQLLVDVQFVQDVLEGARTGDDPEEQYKQVLRRFKKIVTTIRDRIDPFNLDVMDPFLSSKRPILFSRTATLLGHLTQLSSGTARNASSGSGYSPGSLEKQVTLPMSGTLARFPLLPVAQPEHSNGSYVAESSMSHTSAASNASTGPGGATRLEAAELMAAADPMQDIASHFASRSVFDAIASST